MPVLIYALMVSWFRSFLTSLILMVAIPFSLVGILPAHAAMDAFFTATSMIGFMAGAEIVVRNSIILVDFIEQCLRQRMPVDEAVVHSGAVILADPIFQGFAMPGGVCFKNPSSRKGARFCGRMEFFA